MLTSPFPELLHALGAELAQPIFLLVGQNPEDFVADLRAGNDELRLKRRDVLRLSAYGGFVEASFRSLPERGLFLAQLLHQRANRIAAVRENISDLGALGV